jgi:hypothetical protein
MSVSVAFGQPIYESSPGVAHLSVVRMVAHSVAAGINVRHDVTIGVPVDRARCLLAKWAQEEGASHLLMIDSDIVVPEDTLVRLLARKVPVVGALCPQRWYPYLPNAGDLGDGGFEALLNPAPGLHRVGAVGGGCLLVETDVFAHFGDDPPFVTGMVGDTEYSEDFFFVSRCNEFGISVYLDADVRCGHFTGAVIDADGSAALTS